MIFVVWVAQVLVRISPALLVGGALLLNELILNLIYLKLFVIIIRVERWPSPFEVIPFFASVIIIVFIRKIVLYKVVKVHLDVRVVNH